MAKPKTQGADARVNSLTTAQEAVQRALDLWDADPVMRPILMGAQKTIQRAIKTVLSRRESAVLKAPPLPSRHDRSHRGPNVEAVESDGSENGSA
jgi:hypothetical protein